MRERNEALDCRSTPARLHLGGGSWIASEERHWRELERQLGLASPPAIETPYRIDQRATLRRGGGLAVSGNRNTGRRVIKKPLAVPDTPRRNMSLATRIESLVIRVAQEFNDVRAKAGNLANLTTTDKSNLVAAINELKAAVVSSAVIDDAHVAATTTTYSSNKIVAASMRSRPKSWAVPMPYDDAGGNQQLLQFNGTSGLDAARRRQQP